MNRYRVTPFFYRSSMEMTLEKVMEEGHFARPGRTAKYPFCVITEVDGARFLKSLGFRPIVTQTAELMEVAS